MIRSSIALLLILQLLLAGVPWSVRSHWCGGHLADRSFWGGEVSCGMEDDAADCPNAMAAVAGVPCCSNSLVAAGGLPSFVKIASDAAPVIVPTVIPLPPFAGKELGIAASIAVPPAHPPDLPLTGRLVLERIHRFLI
ncbi:MAG: hypothetical protein KF843_02125 [Flavobacteriales bacterium]|nr:hypothetical protein [Flavobacteriales bacterium]